MPRIGLDTQISPIGPTMTINAAVIDTQTILRLEYSVLLACYYALHVAGQNNCKYNNNSIKLLHISVFMTYLQ
jgi:hypothetical protein